jgi:hypothetical protein
MMLRHIKPGTPEWEDAVDVNGAGFEPLTPEELVKLRRIISLEEMTMGMPGVPWLLPSVRPARPANLQRVR